MMRGSPVKDHQATLTRPTRTPWWGTASDRRAAGRALLYAVALTTAYVLAVSLTSAPPPSQLEVFATVTSLTCVWITRKQNVLCMPLGLLGVLATAAFFFRIDLVAQGWLNIAYYLPIQIVGWRMWIRHGADHTDRPVSWTTPRGRVLVGAWLVVGTVVLTALFQAVHGWNPLLLWDTSIVVASMAAQWLLSLKKIDSWWLWLLPVDISAIALYAVSGAHLFAALYVVYLILAVLGLRDWVRARRAQGAGLSALEARLR